MNDEIIIDKWRRLIAGGRTAAKVGGTLMHYYAKRPFLADKEQAKTRAARQSAETLFQGLAVLKGTALKIAQQLSLETDLLPEAACRELAKAYHQVPSINKALVRQVIRDGLGCPPEEIFTQFDPVAFAAASLGQVHRAVDSAGCVLAVKIQYPGITQTIDNDIRLIAQMIRPIIRRDQLQPAIAEIEARLREETDYCQEAANIEIFRSLLTISGMRIPESRPNLSCSTVLTTTLLPGRPLDTWLDSDPGQEARDTVAGLLHRFFLEGLYAHHMIHADPNPGNFIIAEDNTVGLVDFGCVKTLPEDFVEQYRQLSHVTAHGRTRDHFDCMIRLGLIPPNLDLDTIHDLREISDAVCGWFSRLYQQECFDFSASPNFILEGKKLMQRFHALRRHLKMNPNFIFLDRTRYGLLRLFERMGARVMFRNEFEW